MIITRRIDLLLLQEELATAGILVTALGTSGPNSATPAAPENLFTYDAAGAAAELPPGSAPVVDAHVAPPLVVDHVETRPVDVVTRTTDGVFRELWRLLTKPKHTYRAALELRATDATDGTTKAQEARLVFKGGAGSPVQVGATVVLWVAQDAAATGWTVQAQVQGAELVFGVRGAAGKTIDWSVTGELVVFSPEGL